LATLSIVRLTIINFLLPVCFEDDPDLHSFPTRRSSDLEGDFYRGGAILLLYTTAEMMEKVKHQLEKLIEVEYANYMEGSDAYYERSEKHGCRVPSSSRAMTA